MRNLLMLILVVAAALAVAGCVDLDDADPADDDRIAGSDDRDADRIDTGPTPAPDPDGPESGLETVDQDDTYLQQPPQRWVRDI